MAATVLATGMTGGHGDSGNVAGIHTEPPSTLILMKVTLADCLSLVEPHMVARSSSQCGCRLMLFPLWFTCAVGFDLGATGQAKGQASCH